MKFDNMWTVAAASAIGTALLIGGIGIGESCFAPAAPDRGGISAMLTTWSHGSGDSYERDRASSGRSGGWHRGCD